MDHAISSLEDYFECTLKSHIDNWKTGRYKKYSDMGGWEEVEAMCKAINVMKKVYKLEPIRLNRKFKDLLEKEMK